jgi:hypothetical protein
MKASKTSDQPFRYLPAGTNPEEVWRQAYVAYFQPLDWYVVAAFDEANLEKPGKILVRQAKRRLIKLGPRSHREGEPIA